MNPKQKAVENVKSYLDKRVEKNNHKLLDYRGREKVYGLRYENKKDVPFAALDMIKWTIICEACYLVLDEKWDEVKDLFKSRGGE